MDFIAYIIFLLIGSGLGFMLGKSTAKPEPAIDAEAEKQLTALATAKQGLEKQLGEEKAELKMVREEKQTLTTRLAQSEEREKAFKEAQKQAKQEFENLSHKILKETGAEFKKRSEEGLKNLLNPLDTQLKEFKTQITGFRAINESMKSETEKLTTALTSNVKAQGNWGEFTLERILEESGLREGTDYIVQGKGMEIKNDEGGRQMPDVVIKLPEEKHIIIDSKVSLKHFMEYQAAQNEAERAAAASKFIGSTEGHIKGLSSKSYQVSYGIKSLDFVMMFMPLEASYFLLMQEREDIVAKAWDKNIALVCPSTLLPNLKTIAYLWRLEKQNENAAEIARLGGRVYDKIYGFLDNMQETGKAIDKAKEKHTSAIKQLSEGQGNALSQTERLKELGAKTTKSLPSNLLEN